MKKIALLVLVSLCGSTIYAENTQSPEKQQSPKINQPAVENTIRIQTRPEIVGLWGMQIEKKNQCIEYYNFQSNSNVLIKSGNEWSTDRKSVV